MIQFSEKPKRRRLVYTALIGNYETFVGSALQTDPETDLVCFTDSAELVSENWHIRRVEPRFPQDSIRSARFLKIMGPTLFGDYAESLWIDNTVGLALRPDAFMDKMLEGVDLAVPGHSGRETVGAEFDAVSSLGLDDPSRIYEQLFHYAQSMPDILEERPFWTAILVRRHTEPVKELMQHWWEQVLRYSRREQLSFNYSLRMSNVKHTCIAINNRQSEYHRWPVDTSRIANASRASTLTSALISAPVSKLALMQNVVGTLRAKVSALEGEAKSLKAEVSVSKNESLALRHKAETLSTRAQHLNKRLPKDLFQKVLSQVLAENTLRIVQVGTCDGAINDPIYPVLMKNAKQSQLLLIEPQEFLLPIIEANYKDHPDRRVVNCAIGPPGNLSLYRLKEKYHGQFERRYLKDSPTYRVPAGFVSSDKAHVLKHVAGMLPETINAEQAIERFDVPCKRLKEVLGDVGWKGYDVLQVDAEGMDDTVLDNCGLDIYKPCIINFEHMHLKDGRREKTYKFLESLGYRLYAYDQADTMATLLKFDVL